MFSCSSSKEHLLKENMEQKETIEELRKEIVYLKSKVAELEERLNKNSRNSSKPPSTDTPFEEKKKRAARKKKAAERRAGATLDQVDEPDEKERLGVDRCSCCDEDLSGVDPCAVERRQEFDIPPVKVRVKEYQSETKECPRCGEKTKAEFPEHMDNPTVYGANVRALAVYLRNGQFLPLERLSELFRDVLGVPISEGSLVNMTREGYEALEVFETTAKEALEGSAVLHADETGVRVGRKLHWIHVSSNASFTYLFTDPKRGEEGMKNAGLLLNYGGVVVHDGWNSYRNEDFGFVHALCNAHHLRELRSAWENRSQEWGCDLIELLLEMKGGSEMNGGVLDPQTFKEHSGLYDEILGRGFEANPPPQRQPGQRGRLKKGKSLNLLERLRDHKDDVLRFASEPLVPFDNNQAERDLRMSKVRQKISGCFRNGNTANHFCRIHGFIQSVRKHDGNVLEAIKISLRGEQYFSSPPYTG